MPTPWKPPFCPIVVTNCCKRAQILVQSSVEMPAVLSCSLMLPGRTIKSVFLVHAVDSDLYAEVAKYCHFPVQC